MRELSTAGEQALQEIGRRHGFGSEATRVMFDAVARGNGSMAQFSHPEFGGSGQWMRGGMTMVSDMFNHSLKRSVDALCGDLAVLVAELPDRTWQRSEQTESQGPDGARSPRGNGFQPMADWWPGDLGSPNASGSQNGARYAYFAAPRRLAIEVDGEVTVYDTEDHRIGGVSQQQSVGGSLSFTSQHGRVDVAALPTVSGGDAHLPRVERGTAPAPEGERAAQAQDVFGAIERLAELRAKNILSEEEFVTKKADLLSRV